MHEDQEPKLFAVQSERQGLVSARQGQRRDFLSCNGDGLVTLLGQGRVASSMEKSVREGQGGQAAHALGASSLKQPSSSPRSEGSGVPHSPAQGTSGSCPDHGFPTCPPTLSAS